MRFGYVQYAAQLLNSGLGLGLVVAVIHGGWIGLRDWLAAINAAAEKSNSNSGMVNNSLADQPASSAQIGSARIAGLAGRQTTRCELLCYARAWSREGGAMY